MVCHSDMLATFSLGELPSKKRVSYQSSCALSWPGLCCARDAPFWQQLTESADALTKLFVKNGIASEHVHAFCRLRGTWQDGESRLQRTQTLTSFVRLRLSVSVIRRI